MAEPHCSKCCPIKPPSPPAPWAPEYAVYLWLAVILGTIVGGWALVMWMGHTLWH